MNVYSCEGFDDYSGRAFCVVEDGGKFTLKSFSYGSCSGCDRYDGTGTNIGQRLREDSDEEATGNSLDELEAHIRKTWEEGMYSEDMLKAVAVARENMAKGETVDLGKDWVDS